MDRIRAARAATIAAAVFAAGCASHPMPEMQLAVSRLALDSAAASASPDAGEELVLAREKMALARRFAASGSHEAARWLAEQAQVDAELARAKALAASAARKALGWQESVRTLQSGVATPRLVQAHESAR